MLTRWARFVTSHALAVVIAWVALTVYLTLASGGLLGGTPLFDRLSAAPPDLPGEAQDGANLLAGNATEGSSVLLKLDNAEITRAQLAKDVVATKERLVKIDHVLSVIDPFTAGDKGGGLLLTPDRHGLLIKVALRPKLDSGAEREAISQVNSELVQLSERIKTDQPQASVEVNAIPTLMDRLVEQAKKDLEQGELVALPLSLLIMVFVFGGFLAAGVPIAGALASIAGALGMLLGISHFMPLHTTVVSIVTVLGLGLCIDYGLLLVSRLREEVQLHPQDDFRGAVQRTMVAAGRTILFSGLTVAISLAGLLAFSPAVLKAIAIAGVSVVLVAIAVALSLVPALLTLIGYRLVRAGPIHKVPGLRKIARAMSDFAPGDGFFSRLARQVQRAPWLVLIGTCTVLILLAMPTARIKLANSSTELLPPGHPDRVFYEELYERFPNAAMPSINVVVQAPPELLVDTYDVLRNTTGVTMVAPMVLADKKHVSFSIWTKGNDPNSEAAERAVRSIRDANLPYRTWVTGPTASLVDLKQGLAEGALPAVLMVVLATFVLLFLMTGSILVPLKALLMNVVSLGACLGFLVWIFQDGHLSGLLGFKSVGGVDSATPALAIAFGFGLAMDYEVFLLARIKEMRDHGMDNDESVVTGLQQSGRIITSAALIMIVVFLGFATGKLLSIKQLGVALASAVFIDATLVRCLLVPATMTLLGEWNWWAPRPLKRIYHKYGLRH